MLTDIKIDIAGLTADLVHVKAVKRETDNMTTAMICNMYIELCAKIAGGIPESSTSKIVERIELQDGLDRAHRHNINSANRPSVMQQIAFEKEKKLSE